MVSTAPVEVEDPRLRVHAPHSQQRITLADEDLHLLVTAYHTHPLKFILSLLLSLPLLGLPLLIAYRYSTTARVWLLGRPCRIRDATWLHILDQYHRAEIVPVQRVRDPEGATEMRLAEYHHVRMIVDESEGEAQAGRLVLASAWRDPAWMVRAALRQPLTQAAVLHRQLYFGVNVIEVDTKSLGRLLVDEVLHPFYMFQWASIVLWCLDDYFVYSGVLLTMSLASILSTLVQTRAQLIKMRDMARHVCDVRVQRGTAGEWMNLRSDQLVPGDVVDLSSITDVYPCDMLLVSGDVIVNEALLTGEATPAVKRAITDAALHAFDPAAHTLPLSVARHVLFAGTQAVRVRTPSADDPAVTRVNGNGPVALAVVARTGFNTAKGQLVRAMLFPRPAKVSLYRDAFHFVLILTVLAVSGFVYTVVNFVRHNVPTYRIVMRGLDLITVAVPPALPLTVQVGAAFALSRLRAQRIQCTAPTRIHLAGKIDLVVYDKTGTLTQDGLAVLGARGVQMVMAASADADTARLAELRTEPGTGSAALKRVMAACTDVTCVGYQHWLGDPLEVEALRWTKWQHEELPPAAAAAVASHGGASTVSVRGYLLAADEVAPRIVVRPAGSPPRAPTELAVLRWFDFDPDRRCMSVLARATAPARDLEVLCKGAPEAVRERCRADTIPADFNAAVDEYTRHGYRVLAFASKVIPAPAGSDAHIVSSVQVSRADAEQNLEFQGFVVFENRLKPVTSSVVLQLCSARIRQVVCTGDAVLTAVSVARECGIIASLATVYIPQRDPVDGQLEWVNMNRREDRMRMTDMRLRVLDMDDGNGLAEGGDSAVSRHVGSGRKRWNWGKRASRFGPGTSVVMQPSSGDGDGDPWNEKGMEMQDVRAERESMWVLAVTGDAFRQVMASGDTTLVHQMLIRGQVFARMSPEEKRTLVELFRDRLGYRAAYCGDGANDCAALKAADVGIALSEAEASVAAPFTAQVTDIQCVPAVIREGRAALVTTFTCFKYMALYSLLQFTTLTLIYSVGRTLGNGQFLYIDLILVLPISLLLGRTLAAEELAVKRPTLSLMSGKVLVSLAGQIALQAAFQLILFLLVRRQPWFQPAPFPDGLVGRDSDETTALFFLTSFMYTGLAVVVSSGRPYRKPMYTNVLLTLTVVALTALSLALVFAAPPLLQRLMPLRDIPIAFRGVIVALGAAHFVIAWSMELWMFPSLARLGKRAVRKHRLTKEMTTLGKL